MSLDNVFVYIIDTDPKVAESADALFKKHGNGKFVVSGSALTSAQFITDFKNNPRVDVFMLSASIPDINGLEMIPRLRRQRPNAKILVMLDERTRNLFRSAREEADDVLVKNFSGQVLLKVLEKLSGSTSEIQSTGKEKATLPQQENAERKRSASDNVPPPPPGSVPKKNIPIPPPPPGSTTRKSPPPPPSSAPKQPQRPIIPIPIQIPKIRKDEPDRDDPLPPPPPQLTQTPRPTPPPPPPALEPTEKQRNVKLPPVPRVRSIQSPKVVAQEKTPLELRDRKVIAFYSAKGGVGTTSLAINVGVTLAHAYPKKICIVDANVDYPNVGIYLKLLSGKERTIHDLYKIMSSGKRIEGEDIKDVSTQHASGLGVILGPAYMQESMDFDKIEYFHDIITNARSVYNVVLIDTSSYITEGTLAALQMADEIVMVIEPEIGAIVNSVKFFASMKVLRDLDVETGKIKIVMNKDRQSEINIKIIRQALENRDILARIPNIGKDMSTSLDNGVPAVDQPNSQIRESVVKLAESLVPEFAG